MSTSISDSAAYRAACLKAATDPEAFKVFKRDPALNYAWEHVTQYQGTLYLNDIISRMGLLHSSFNRFCRNDAFGTPRVYEYGWRAQFSPTTLRYIWVLGDLIRRFGSIADDQIVEIGGGYGGQAFVAKQFFGQRLNWSIIDLQETTKLQRRYVNCGAGTLEHVHFSPGCVDLVISNYAFSELNRNVQEEYVEKVLRLATHGYITCNFENEGGRMTWADMEKAIPGSKREEHQPFPADGCFLWTW